MLSHLKRSRNTSHSSTHNTIILTIAARPQKHVVIIDSCFQTHYMCLSSFFRIVTNLNTYLACRRHSTKKLLTGKVVSKENAGFLSKIRLWLYAIRATTPSRYCCPPRRPPRSCSTPLRFHSSWGPHSWNLLVIPPPRRSSKLVRLLVGHRVFDFPARYHNYDQRQWITNGITKENLNIEHTFRTTVYLSTVYTIFPHASSAQS